MVAVSELPLEELAGWGRHPVGRARVDRSGEPTLPAGGEAVIARGLGRAYGDAAMPAAPGGLVVECTRADRILGFDGDTGRLTCEAGLSLAEILRVFVPRGWFPPVTPGTKFVTVGACVACDVHGKNHHRDGSFGQLRGPPGARHRRRPARRVRARRSSGSSSSPPWAGWGSPASSWR